MARVWILIARIAGFLSVAAGAFGAHALQGDARASALLGTAAHYGLVHAVALLALATIEARSGPAPPLSVAGWCFAGGIVLFSGTLVALALSGLRLVGAVTPFGGALFLAGWAALAWYAFRLR